MLKIFNFNNLTLLVALSISAIAAWYSVIGLTAIFAGAFIPIIIMGGILEVAKITTTVWLHKHWHRAGFMIKSYLTLAVIALAFLTSMGIFGFLSKAHVDQSVPTGDVAAQVSLLDEKIKTQRENIDLARKALAQMDAQVEQRLARGDTEAGAERAVQIRRQQAGERIKLQRDISDAQREIAKLNEQRAPIASQLRKVEAEVGPIKYIAALIYGDNPDQNVLERAVRWVTILIVIVFDPLAIVLILAANNSIKWSREEQEKSTKTIDVSKLISSEEHQELNDIFSNLDKQEIQTTWPTEWTEHSDPIEKIDTVSVTPNEKSEEVKKEITVRKSKNKKAAEEQATAVEYQPVQEPEMMVSGPEVQTIEKLRYDSSKEYVHFEGKLTSITALRSMRPDLVVSPEEINRPVINFGSRFPEEAFTGEIFIRVDRKPHEVFKFNGIKWLPLDKRQSTTYLQNEEYLKFLINKIENNLYDVDSLTDIEQDEISVYLGKN